MDEMDIPIDINVNKLQNWLVTRRHIPKDWEQKVHNVHAKIKAASEDIPDEYNLKALTSSDHLNYYHCLQIVECLKKTEAVSKNIFGRYSSQRMKDWQEILSLYKQDNIYLADIAHSLLYDIMYEIPNLKKQINKLEQNYVENERKLKELCKAEASALKEFQHSCKQLEIPGVHIKAELLELVKQLSTLYEDISEQAKSIAPALNYYADFVKIMSSGETCIKEANTMKSLYYLTEFGNTAFGEYLQIVELASCNADVAVIREDCIEPVNIDVMEDGFEIINADTSVSDEEISGISIVEECETNVEYKCTTVLEDSELRANIINALMEVDAFFKMRLVEMSSEDHIVVTNQIQDVSMHSIDDVAKLARTVTQLLDSLTDERLIHLQNISNSPNYLDLLTNNLQRKLLHVNKQKQKQKQIQEKNVQISNEIEIVKPSLNLLVNNVKYLQNKIEEDLSVKYKGRYVNIIGAINII